MNQGLKISTGWGGIGAALLWTATIGTATALAQTDLGRGAYAPELPRPAKRTTTIQEVPPPSYRAPVRPDPLVVPAGGAQPLSGVADVAPLPESRLTLGLNSQPDWGFDLELRELTRVEKGPDQVCLDLDRLGRPWLLRPRRKGDRLAPYRGTVEPEARPTTRLKSLLQKSGVPRSQRDHVPILECGGEIAWVAGLRPDRRYAADEKSRRILLVRLVRP